MTDYLFVYGTLRKNYDLKLKHQVKDDLRYTGQGKIGAAMYDLGRYPGAVKDSRGSEVVGDVFEVKDASAVFRVLDKYEGAEFVRKKGRVRMRNGEELNAWIYWYAVGTAGKRPIPNKDYLNYLKNKSIH